MDCLEKMRDAFIEQVQAQLGHLECVDTKEMGEVIDIIKDLEEAIYYCTITEAMQEKAGNEMYYYTEHEHLRTQANAARDKREGASPLSRKHYLEVKSMNVDKVTQVKELEKYMNELTSDIVEMIQDASPEEKQLLHKKMQMLTSKIEQI